MLSPYSLYLLNKLGKKIPPKNMKLVPNLSDKYRYILHYRNLKFYLQMGLKLTYIHRVIQFKQSPWLKSYIDFNTNMRARLKMKNKQRRHFISFIAKTTPLKLL